MVWYGSFGEVSFVPDFMKRERGGKSEGNLQSTQCVMGKLFAPMTYLVAPPVRGTVLSANPGREHSDQAILFSRFRNFCWDHESNLLSIFRSWSARRDAIAEFVRADGGRTELWRRNRFCRDEKNTKHKSCKANETKKNLLTNVWGRGLMSHHHTHNNGTTSQLVTSFRKHTSTKFGKSWFRRVDSIISVGTWKELVRLVFMGMKE